MKKIPAPKIVPMEPSEDDIRECAYRIYEQSGCVPGRDLENWLAAKTSLEANLAAKSRAARPRHASARKPAAG